MIDVILTIFLIWLLVTGICLLWEAMNLGSARSSFLEYDKKSKNDPYFRERTLNYAREYAAARRKFLRSPLWPIDLVIWLTSGARKRREQTLAILKYAEGNK